MPVSRYELLHTSSKWFSISHVALTPGSQLFNQEHDKRSEPQEELNAAQSIL
ncbi:hypothetical protein Baya_5856 [Bagarius yarrelli]|uniref:Uncharacterized protein n=1 Tax=Bagarius yarrelli TaxID=175774 RepID=A0A556TXQ4_BAGYA|nr:hypothetical protein Baya_5856 [Bagarius yarrelli]